MVYNILMVQLLQGQTGSGFCLDSCVSNHTALQSQTITAVYHTTNSVTVSSTQYNHLCLLFAARYWKPGIMFMETAGVALFWGLWSLFTEPSFFPPSLFFCQTNVWREVQSPQINQPNKNNPPTHPQQSPSPPVSHTGHQTVFDGQLWAGQDSTVRMLMKSRREFRAPVGLQLCYQLCFLGLLGWSNGTSLSTELRMSKLGLTSFKKSLKTISFRQHFYWYFRAILFYVRTVFANTMWSALKQFVILHTIISMSLQQVLLAPW